MRSRISYRSNRIAMTCKDMFLAVVTMFVLSSDVLGAQGMDKPIVSRTAAEEQCIGNLRRIHKLIKLDQHRSGGELPFPSNFARLNLMAREPKPFVCPADKDLGNTNQPDTLKTSYEIVNNPKEPKLAKVSAGRVAIVIEKIANHNGQRFVLFYDGSVKGFDGPQFDALKSNSFIDAGPGDAPR